MRLFKDITIFFIFFFCLSVVGLKGVKAGGVQIPDIREFDPQSIEHNGKLFIKGSIESGTEALIYIDGTYVDTAQGNFANNQTGEFFYEHSENLSVGEHWLIVVASDRTSLVLSPPTREMWFMVEELPSAPAPTMLEPVVNNKAINTQPFIVGLSKNDTTIKIYIDEKLDGEFKVENHKSGTANFAYKPSYALNRGAHLIYATATGINKKESIRSNDIPFRVLSPSIASGASEEKFEVAVKSAELNFEEGGIGNIAQSANNNFPGDKNPEQGFINENKINPNKLSFNIIAFIVFIITLVGLIIRANIKQTKQVIK